MKPSDVLQSKRQQVLDLISSYKEQGISDPCVFNDTASGTDEEGDPIDIMVTVSNPQTGILLFYKLKAELAFLLDTDNLNLVDKNSLSRRYRALVSDVRPL